MYSCATPNEKECQHEEVIVDYMHPHGDICGVSVKELQGSIPSSTRAVMELHRPRCLRCGLPLGLKLLTKRIRAGGDLHDARFRWIQNRDAHSPLVSKQFCFCLGMLGGVMLPFLMLWLVWLPLDHGPWLFWAFFALFWVILFRWSSSIATQIVGGMVTGLVILLSVCSWWIYSSGLSN